MYPTCTDWPQVELAENWYSFRFVQAFFCQRAEANEAAIKRARKYFYRQGQTGRHDIIVFKESFHGRTLAPLLPPDRKYQEGFAPLPAGFKYASLTNWIRRSIADPKPVR